MTGNLESELLPPALEAAFRVVAETGAIGVDDLARRLSGQGISSVTRAAAACS